MSKLFEKDHAPIASQALRVSLLRIGPHAELAAIRDRLAAARDGLTAAMTAVDGADDAVIAQNAQVRYEDRILDRLVMRIARDKRATLDTSRPDEQPSFRDLFPRAPSDAMHGAADKKQSTFVAAVLAGLGRPENADLAARHGDALRAQQAKVDAAVARRDELERDAGLKRIALERAVAAARDAFNEAQLDTASITHDEDLVASLFDFRVDHRPRSGGGGSDSN